MHTGEIEKEKESEIKQQVKRKHCIGDGKHFHSPLVSSLENR